MKTLLVVSNEDGFIVTIQRKIEKALDELQIEWKTCFLEDTYEVSKQFQPAMTLFFHPNHKIYKYKDEIKDLKGHKLMWSMEDPYESDITFDMADYIYYIFTSDEGTAEALKKERGSKNKIFYVPHACDPDIHKAMEVDYDHKSDVLFIGNAYDSRIKYFQEHAEKYKHLMVTIIGVGWRGMYGYENQRIMHTHVSEPELVKYYNGAKTILNLHRQNSDLDMANSRKLAPVSYNNRFYEIASCGKEQLVVGRGKDFTFNPYTDDFDAQSNSYTKRLSEFYTPILKG